MMHFIQNFAFSNVLYLFITIIIPPRIIRLEYLLNSKFIILIRLYLLSHLLYLLIYRLSPYIRYHTQIVTSLLLVKCINFL